ncbi:MAG TPA: hypothetical protein VGM44_21555, partial [Polyangiaceae bacterium]
MARRLVGSGAFATSIVVHALLLGAGALVLTHSLGERAREPAKLALAAPLGEVEIDVAPATIGASESTPQRDSAAPPAATSTPPPPGGGPPERHPDTERAGRGGSRTAEQMATNLASHVDPITLETNPITHLDRSQVSRLRTAQERRSWEDHRSTPNPMELTFVATGRGVVQERRDPGFATRGSIAGATPAPV